MRGRTRVRRRGRSPRACGPGELHDAAIEVRACRRRARGEDDLRADGDVRRPRHRVLTRVVGGDRPPGRALHRHLHLRLPAACSSSTATPTRWPTCSSHDIEQGIQGTEIKAAFLKCAADEPGVTENVEKVHRAVARASVRTGAPIMAHSRPASEHRAAADRDLRRGGRRPGAGPDRPHRRHRRPRLHRAAARQGRLHRHGPLRAGDLPADRAAKRDGRSRCSSAATPSACSSPRTSARRSTGSRSRWGAAAGRRRREGLGHPDRPSARDPGPQGGRGPTAATTTRPVACRNNVSEKAAAFSAAAFFLSGDRILARPGPCFHGEVDLQKRVLRPVVRPGASGPGCRPMGLTPPQLL